MYGDNIMDIVFDVWGCHTWDEIRARLKPIFDMERWPANFHSETQEVHAARGL